MAEQLGQEPEDARIETLIEQGLINSYMGEAAANGVFAPQDEAMQPRESQPDDPRHAHRSGRAYSEKSGRDVSRELANAEYRPLSDEERARNIAGVEAARMALRRTTAVEHYDGLEQYSPAQRMAILRKRNDEEIERQRRRSES